MVVNEKETNIKEVCYSTFGYMPFPLVRFKAILDYFCSDDSIVISVEKGKVFETFKVFQYDVSKANESSLSYSIYEFINSRKKEFIVRVVEWDRNKAKKAVSEKSEEIQMELNSEIYYISGDLSFKMKSLLIKIRNYFKSELTFKKTDTMNLNSKVCVDYNGFSKTIQWGSPFADQKTELFLDKVVAEIYLLVGEISDNIIPKAEVLFNLNPYEYEKILLG